MSAVNDHINATERAIRSAEDAKSMAGIGGENTLNEAENLIIRIRDEFSGLAWSQDEEFQDIIEKADDILDEFKTEARSNWLVGAIGDLRTNLERLRDELNNG